MSENNFTTTTQTLRGGCVPITSAFLDLVTILQLSRKVFLSEDSLAASLGKNGKNDALQRCRDLFFKTHAEYVDAIGLHRNEITYESLVNLDIPDFILSMEFSALEKTFFFDPWAFQGKGGIYQFKQ